MLERKKPFRKLRVAEEICKKLEEMQKREGDEGYFNNYAERIYSEVISRGRRLPLYVPEDMSLIEYVATIQAELIEFVKRAPGKETVRVRGVRPKTDYERQQHRKTGTN